MALRRAGKGYVLGVKSNDPFRSWGKPQTVAGTAKEIADGLPASAWRRLSAGGGTKGEQLHDWAYLELADLDAGEYNEALAGQAWTRGLLIRRKTRRRSRFFHDVGPARDDHRKTGENRRTSLGDRRRFQTTKNDSVTLRLIARMRQFARVTAAYLRMSLGRNYQLCCNNDNVAGLGRMLSMVEASSLKRVRF